MWNVKEYLRQITEGSEQSINRNIVECKVEHGDIIIRSIPGINRNIVECKDFGQSVTMHVTEVLIETLWNVKDTIKNLYIISVMLY